MKTYSLVVALMCCWATLAAAGAGGTGGAALEAEGLIQFDPPQALGCIAARVEVPADKMIVALRWYNGAATGVLPKVLVATGNGSAPPSYDDAITVAENVQGQDLAWSVVEFSTPVASESGTLFVIVQYPGYYAPPVESTSLGVGYALVDSPYPYFVTGDGETWIGVSSRCRVLLEPVLADRVPGVLALSGPGQKCEDIPLQKQGLYAAPNPFNPQVSIALHLKEATTGDIRIYDIRGHLVVELHSGPLAQGANSFEWQGRDSGGRSVASGAYWVRARTGDESHTIKVMLLR